MGLQNWWKDAQLEAQAYAHVAMDGVCSIPGRLDRVIAHHRIPDIESELEALRYQRGDGAIDIGQDMDQDELGYKIRMQSDLLNIIRPSYLMIMFPLVRLFGKD